MSNIDWDMILKLISKNKVVPVIGNDLLIIKKGDEHIPLYAYITQKLGTKLNIDVKGLNFREFVLENQRNSTLMDEIEDFLEDIDKENILIVDHIEKLARITGFNFFISTNFDPIFEQILERERCTPPKKVNTIYYTQPPIAQTLIQEDTDNVGPTVFKILGSFNKTCAITEEEVLEYIFSLNDDNNVGRYLFDKLERKRLLFLGCDFPNWLLRFFIRSVTHEPFSIDSKLKYIADNYVHKDIKLSHFLQHFKTSIVCLSQEKYDNPIKFIDELYNKWIQQNSTNQQMRYNGAIFISYSHHDKDTVLALYNELLAHGFNVWLDKDQLHSGDNYRQQIIEKIRECDLFIPVISQSSISNKESYVYSIEWDRAIARRKTREEESDTHSFIHPIIIDDTQVTDIGIPSNFRQLTIAPLDTPQLIQVLKARLKPISDENESDAKHSG
ncbi:SIR2-like domain-containing protein [Saccharicrinis carchari]|uniref:SIR2-like domain-containing protein n=1 Tax=Saccharicrinis carchari TaxID=1168039 RepID=A0A521D3B1_SACCC|nr:toll/interleukin-1 receptor domain-containing protein [Saccharicrinis carchari]SMO66185.1 SIR2-like domain-containing protein [Saccharicrinis carchari]